MGSKIQEVFRFVNYLSFWNKLKWRDRNLVKTPKIRYSMSIVK